jgi:RHS repeat-associated protein
MRTPKKHIFRHETQHQICRTLLLSAAVILGARALSAQYLLDTGAPTWATPQQVSNGVINLGNGNVHIEIPVASIPQRGGRPFIAKMVYDSRIWKVVDTGGSQSWQPRNVYGTTPDVPTTPPGWRFLATDRTAVSSDYVLNQCTYQGSTYYWGKYSDYRFYDVNGTVRHFPLYAEGSNPCHTAETPTTSGPSLDATGYWMQPNSNQSGAQEVLAPDGTKEYFQGILYGPVIPWIDPNGNYLHRDINNGWVTYDTVNRPVMQITAVGNNEVDYTVQTSSGSSTFRMIYTTQVTASTQFNAPGVSEYNGGWYTLAQIVLPSGASYQFNYEASPNNYGLLTSMTLPTGQTVQFTHANFTDAQGNRNRWISSMVDGGGTETFTPATCGTNCNKLTVTRPSGDETVYTFSLNGGAWNTLTKAYTGSAASGTLALTVQYDYDTSLGNPVAGGAGFVRRIRSTATVPGPAGDLVKKTEGDYDTFTYAYRGTNYSGSRGNTTAMREYGYGAGVAGALLRQMTMSYLHESNPSYLARNIVHRLADYQTKNASGTKIAEMTSSYDSTTLTAATGITHHDDANYGTSFTLRGNPTVTQHWTGSGYVSTTFVYDTTGQVRTTTDPNGNATQVSYADVYYTDNGANPPTAYSPSQPTNAFVTQITMPLSGNISYGYYYGSSNRAKLTDQNSRTTYFHYMDPLNRPTIKNLPGGGWVQNQFTTATHTIHNAAIAAGTFQDEHESDTLGRPSSSSLTDPEGTVYGGSSYDALGRLVSVLNPYRSTSDPTYGSDTVQYDSLNRLTRVTLQDANYTDVFYGAAVGANGGLTAQLCSTATYGIGYPTFYKDELGKKKQSWADALGEVMEVDEPDASGALMLATCSMYDALGDLVQVDQGSLTRQYVFDPAGRLSSRITPEGGTETLYYTTAGGALCSGDQKSICRSTDARGITTTYTYDAENRLTGKSYSNSDPSAAYYYDQTSYNGLTITNGRGRRTGMSDGSGQAAWSYSVEGAVLTERRTIAGITKTISYTYNVDGSRRLLTYPSGMILGNSYNSAGRLTQVACAAWPCSGTVFAQVNSYNAFGAPASITQVGLTSTYTFNNRFQPVNLKTTANGTVTLIDLTYSFVQAGGKNNGLVASLTNNLVSGRSQTFTYDELNRLKTAQSQANSGADCWGQSFGYDRYGNLSAITVTKCSAPALSLGINNKNQITNGGFNYDLAGNLAGDGTATYTWTAEDQLASTSGVSYTYDGDGRRVKKSNGKLYWYAVTGEVLAESDLSGNVQSEYIYMGRRRIARRDPSGSTYFFITDHIGSVRLVVSPTGTVVEDSEYYPFGNERPIVDTMNNSIKFADMERDSESGLDHTLFRQYSASLARWLSPDVQQGSPENPQSLNRYPYVLNDPLSLTDPLGASPSFDPYLVGCFPDTPLSNAFGCGWSEDNPCPPGFIPVYGDPAAAPPPSKRCSRCSITPTFASARIRPGCSITNSVPTASTSPCRRPTS